MKVMVCTQRPYLEALRGLQHLLCSICIEPQAEIHDPRLAFAETEEQLQHQLVKVNSSRRFLANVRRLAGPAGVKVDRLRENLFLMRVGENKILVGALEFWRPVVVAFEGPAETNFADLKGKGVIIPQRYPIGLKPVQQAEHPDFQDPGDYIDSYSSHNGWRWRQENMRIVAELLGCQLSWQ